MLAYGRGRWAFSQKRIMNRKVFLTDLLRPGGGGGGGSHIKPLRKTNVGVTQA